MQSSQHEEMSFGAFQSTHSHTRVSELDHARLNGIDFLSTENDPWVESTLSAMSDAQECARGKFPTLGKNEVKIFLSKEASFNFFRKNLAERRILLRK